MQTSVIVRHGTISQDAQDLMRSKAEERLLHVFDRVMQIDIIVDQESSHRTKVELIVDAEHKTDFVSSAQGELVQKTFDAALAKVEQQLRRYKKKIQDHRHDASVREVAAGLVEGADEPGGTAVK